MRCPACASPAEKQVTFESWGDNFRCFWACPDDTCEGFEVNLGPAEYDGPESLGGHAFPAGPRISLIDGGRPVKR